MVRVNIIEPRALADQHLLAEHTEILMLLSYVRNYPSPTGIPAAYTLGTGHMKFFANKLVYLKRRHRAIRGEMALRGFESTKRVKIARLAASLRNDWQPGPDDVAIIRARIIERLHKRPGWYRYYGAVKSAEFLSTLIERAQAF